MIQSPLLEELKAEWTREVARETSRKNILKCLEARFGIAARAMGAKPDPGTHAWGRLVV